MDRRAEVVSEPRQRQLTRACPAPDLGLLLHDLDVETGTRQRHSGDEAIRSRADHERATHLRTVSFMFPSVPRATRPALLILLLAAALAATAGRSAADGSSAPDGSTCATT